jgi:xanthosine utilization system XapX-like protein
MIEQYEQVGVVGTETFPLVRQYWDGQTVHSTLSNERIVPMLFKNLNPGTKIYIKVDGDSND